MSDDEELYDAVRDITDGNDLGAVLKVMVITAAECMAQMTECALDEALIADVNSLLRLAYTELCSTTNSNSLQ